MPRLINPEHYGPAEVLYAVADSLAHTAKGSARSGLLKDRLEQFIREDHLRQALRQMPLMMDHAAPDTVRLSVSPQGLSDAQTAKSLHRLAAALRGVAEEGCVREGADFITVAGLDLPSMHVVGELLAEATRSAHRPHGEVTQPIHAAGKSTTGKSTTGKNDPGIAGVAY